MKTNLTKHENSDLIVIDENGVRMDEIIMGLVDMDGRRLRPGSVIHLDGDGLNNCRKNLMVVPWEDPPIPEFQIGPAAAAEQDQPLRLICLSFLRKNDERCVGGCIIEEHGVFSAVCRAYDLDVVPEDTVINQVDVDDAALRRLPEDLHNRQLTKEEMVQWLGEYLDSDEERALN